jgi:hypothetical protein
MYWISVGGQSPRIEVGLKGMRRCGLGSWLGIVQRRALVNTDELPVCITPWNLITSRETNSFSRTILRGVRSRRIESASVWMIMRTRTSSASMCWWRSLGGTHVFSLNVDHSRFLRNSGTIYEPNRHHILYDRHCRWTVRGEQVLLFRRSLRLLDGGAVV